jgi:TetR/AcrR family transcriptional repressor of bet genes
MATPVDRGDALDARDERILTATEGLIAELGYDRVRLIDIADRSGVSVGSLQHRFRTREGLLRATVEHVAVHEIDDVMGAAATVEDPYQRLVALLEGTLHSIDPAGPPSLLWFELVVVSTRNEELKEILSRGNANWHTAFAETIEEGLAVGRFTTDLAPAQLTTVLVSLIDGFAVHRILGHGQTSPTELAATARAVLDSLVELS